MLGNRRQKMWEHSCDDRAGLGRVDRHALERITNADLLMLKLPGYIESAQAAKTLRKLRPVRGKNSEVIAPVSLVPHGLRMVSAWSPHDLLAVWNSGEL